ncbi:hypothetical protein [uncultured Rothia sp.]|uniref:hypothetical protein n=1 Tax=uncultured Rothia sp. TaxID=316088 RepID=UPI003217076E
MLEPVKNQKFSRTRRIAQEHVSKYLTTQSVTVTLSVITLLCFTLHIFLGQGTESFLFYPRSMENIAPLISGIFFIYRPHNALVAVLFLLALGFLVEKNLGRLKFALVAVAAYLVPAIILIIIFSLLTGAGQSWVQELGTHYSSDLMSIGLAVSHAYLPNRRLRTMCRCLKRLCKALGSNESRKGSENFVSGS